jgi:RimJ/RimL family protein N-acetyltransferase
MVDVILETERLVMSQWQDSDWIEFRPIATDPEVMRYITGGVPWSDEMIRSFVDRQVKLYKERGFCRWKLTEKMSRQMAGFCGVGTFRDNPDFEIGWWLARGYWGRGLATEAAKAALHDIFERVMLERVISIARPSNVASTRIMEKIGLEFEREFQNEGVHLVQYKMDRATYTARLSAAGGSD